VARTAVGQRRQLAPDAAQVHVDAAIIGLKGTAKPLFGKLMFADCLPCFLDQHLQQIEFGIGQRHILPRPGNPPLR
jgi:hypothetical protein